MKSKKNITQVKKRIILKKVNQSFYKSGKDIVDIVAGQPSPKSEINLFRETTKSFDSRQKFQADKAYEGEKSIKTPNKKPKKRELTPKELEKNKELASERIFVEHLIRLGKIFRVAQERFRLNKNKYEQIIMTICGLVRLRIGTFIF